MLALPYTKVTLVLETFPGNPHGRPTGLDSGTYAVSLDSRFALASRTRVSLNNYMYTTIIYGIISALACFVSQVCIILRCFLYSDHPAGRWPFVDTAVEYGLQKMYEIN